MEQSSTIILLKYLQLFYANNINLGNALQLVRTDPTLELLDHKTLTINLEQQLKLVILKQQQREIENDFTWLNSKPNFHHIVTFNDAAYPPLLREIAKPPLLLFVQGDVSTLKDLQIAIVGSRKASLYGRSVATKFAQTLSEHGIVVTSGLALGIDGIAHRAVLGVGTGRTTVKNSKTIAVLGTGLARIYPASHCSLANMIAEQGALVSEFSRHTGPIAYNFPQRNRIISGMSFGVLVVEAALNSGSLITAAHALEQNREVFVIPGEIYKENFAGCNQLIRQGAKLVETVEHIFEELPLLSHLLDANRPRKVNSRAVKRDIKIKPDTIETIQVPQPTPVVTLSTPQHEVIAQIKEGFTTVEELCIVTKFAIAELNSILTMLVLDGCLAFDGMHYLVLDMG